MAIKPNSKLREEKAKLIELLKEQGSLRTERVISAFEAVPREKFVPRELLKYAYANEPLPIGKGQTISQPATVAAMTEALDVHPGQNILEVGAGSGYQAAIIAKIIGSKGRLTTTERIPELVRTAKANLASIGIRNVQVVEADGTKGYSKHAPYDRIIVTAEAPDIPPPLLDQLKPNGKMVLPVQQQLWLVTKDSEGKISRELLGFYAFVPLIGEYGFPHPHAVAG